MIARLVNGFHRIQKNRQGTMKKIIGFVVGGAIILLLIIGIARTRQSEEALSIAKIQQAEGIPIFANHAEFGEVKVVRSYYGTVRAKNQAVVSARLMDRIDRILVTEGDRVSKGQVVVRFDTTATMASVTQARLQYINMKRDFDRMNSLFDQGGISRQALDQVELGYRVAEENYQTARRTVELIAPISGVVARVDVEAGTVAFPGDVLMKIVSDRDFEVTFDVTQEDRSYLKPGQAVLVFFDSVKGISGTITNVSLATSDQSRLFTGYATIPAADGIYPGVLANVQVTVDQRSDVLQVPQEAIVMRGGKPFVVTVIDDLATLVPVTLGLAGEGNVEVLEGLEPGMVYAVYGHKTLEEGNRVKIVDEHTELAEAR